MGNKINLLLVEDDKFDQLTFRRYVEENSLNIEYEIKSSVNSAKEAIASQTFDVILCDYFLEDGSALDLLEITEIPIIVVSGAGDELISVEAMKKGAYDYIIKDINGNYLNTILSRINGAIEKHNLEKKVKEYQVHLETILNERTKQLKKEIYEKQLIEFSLEDTEIKYKKLVENSLAGIYISQDYYIRYCNKRFAEIFGYDSPKELLGVSTKDLVASEDWETVRTEVNKRLVGGKEFSHFNVKGKKKNGELFDLEIIGSAIQYEGGPAIQGMALDISERKKALRALEESEKNYQDLYENSPDIYLTIEPAAYKIVKCNKTTSEILGFERKEVLGKSITDLLHKNSVGNFEEKLKPLREGKRINNVEAEMLKKDGSVIYSIINANPVIKDGKVKSFRFTIRDISEIKAIQDELKKSKEELYLANKNKDKFLSIMAHDIRSPLTSIMGMLQLLNDEFETLDNNDLRELVSSSYNGTKKLFELIEGLLDWSLLKLGKKEFIIVNVELKAIVRDCLEALDFQLKSKNIHVENKVKGNIFVKVDMNMLKSILRNLIINAVKFSNRGSQIVIDSFYEGPNVVIVIQDYGVGIKEENIDKLFKIDKHISTLGTEKEKGTGLGLILCKELVEKNNGSISLESIPGKGTTFYVRLPKA